MEHSAHATFSLRYHLVLVTKYRRKVLDRAMRQHLERHLDELLAHWRCTMLEFGAEEDHVHILFEAHPALRVSALVNNLKTASSRALRKPFGARLQRFYSKPGLWHRAYYIGTVGHASLETVKRYIAAQPAAA